jgi:hypothetical protein
MPSKPQCCEIYTARDFDESHVLSLLGLLREESLERSVLRELGDLLAHRRHTEGRVYEYMRRVKQQADRFSKTGGTPQQPELIFTETQIAKALNDGLRRHGLGPLSQERDLSEVPTAQARSRQVSLVILATLQRIALQYDGKEFGWLELWVTPDAFQLTGWVIPNGLKNFAFGARALEVGNDFCPVPDRYLKPKGDGVWKIYVEGGETRLDGLW